MACYLLDTNHLSPLVTSGHRLISKVKHEVEMGAEFAITVPILAEFLFGIGMTPRFDENFKRWQAIRGGFIFYDIDAQIAEHAAYLQIALRKRGWQLFMPDALIAAVALRYDLILLTTDQDYRALPELVTENWLSLP